MSQPCGCTVELSSNSTFVSAYIIDYCPKHQAIDELMEACKKARSELGVPQPGYIAPVANAYHILNQAITKLEPPDENELACEDMPEKGGSE